MSIEPPLSLQVVGALLLGGCGKGEERAWQLSLGKVLGVRVRQVIARRVRVLPAKKGEIAGGNTLRLLLLRLPHWGE